jgi:2-polyprenyl-6-methoxyphenol hydroxylase-like FAD-dependent oxidoreductase
MSQPYDAIVVGARCAGSPTAMLLARRGHRVLVVDRATFPSDTISTHLIHPPGVASLERWGLLDAVVSRGSPPNDT